MNRVLIISSKKSSIEGLEQLLGAELHCSADSTMSAREGQALANENTYDLIIVDSPLADGRGNELAVSLAQKTDSCILLIVPREQEQELEVSLSEQGVCVIAKPVSRSLLHKTLLFINAGLNRLRGIRNEKTELQRKNEEIRLLNRAKGILMEYLSMSETQAHRYLEKQAMDLRITKIEVAKRLLSTYEN